MHMCGWNMEMLGIIYFMQSRNIICNLGLGLTIIIANIGKIGNCIWGLFNEVKFELIILGRNS